MKPTTITLKGVSSPEMRSDNPEFVKAMEDGMKEAARATAGTMNRVMFGLTRLETIDTTPQNGCAHEFFGSWHGMGNWVEECRFCRVEKSSKTVEIDLRTGEEYRE